MFDWFKKRPQPPSGRHELGEGCPHCGSSVRQTRADGRCASCGKLLPEQLRAAPPPPGEPRPTAQPRIKQGLTPHGVSLEQAFAAPPEVLARGVLYLQYCLHFAKYAQRGGRFLTDIDGAWTEITSANAQPAVTELQQRLQTCAEVIDKRGFQQLHDAYDAVASPGAERLALFTGPVLVQQDGFSFSFSLGSFKHRGVIVESTLVIEHAESPDVMLVGRPSDGQIAFSVTAPGLAAHSGPAQAEYILTLTAQNCMGSNFAEAFAGRAVAWWREGEYGKALQDLHESLRINADCVPALQVHASLLATCPDAGYRDGRRAIDSASRACQLTSEGDWVSSHILAAAYAEAGDFNQATLWATRAIERAPEREADALRQRLDLYRSGRPYRTEQGCAIF